jgi:hypothetical protein
MNRHVGMHVTYYQHRPFYVHANVSDTLGDVKFKIADKMRDCGISSTFYSSHVLILELNRRHAGISSTEFDDDERTLADYGLWAGDFDFNLKLYFFRLKADEVVYQVDLIRRNDPSIKRLYSGERCIC